VQRKSGKKNKSIVLSKRVTPQDEYSLLKDGYYANPEVGDLLIPASGTWGGFVLILGESKKIDGVWDVLQVHERGERRSYLSKHNLRLFCNRINPDKRWMLYKGD
jgi:hypothetical protein